MSFNTNILKDKIEGIKEAFQNGDFGDALVGALNTGSGLMQQRIFQNNTDVEGNNFGPYVGRKTKTKAKFSANKTQNKRNQNIAGLYLTSYQKKRARLGRQINHKDLELTGGLRRAIETQVESETTAILQFNNDLAAKTAHGQEAQITNIRNGRTGNTNGIGIKIFTLNQTEKEAVNEQGLALINQILKPK